MRDSERSKLKKEIALLKEQIAEFEKDKENYRQTEESSTESKTRNSNIAEIIPYGIQEIDTKGIIIYANSAYHKMLGFENGTLIGKSMYCTLSDPTETTKLKEFMKKILKQQPEPKPWFSKITKTDGNIMDVQTLWNYIRDRNGEITGFVSVILNVKERKIAEKVLQIDRNNLDNIFNSMADGVHVVDKDYNILNINKTLESQFGKFDGRKCYEYFHNRNEACTWCKNEEVFQGKTVYWELYVPHVKKTFSLIDTPIINTDGSISKLEIVRDITEHKQAEEKLQDSEERFRTVANFTNDWEYWVSPKGKMLYVSPSCKRITGYSDKEFLNNSDLLKSIVHKHDVNILARHKHILLETGETDPIEFRIKTKLGKVKWIGHICQTVYNEDGVNLGIRGSNRDITERKAAEEALKASEENYKNIFDNNPVPLFEEDWLETKEILEQEKAKGITISKEYFDKNPEFFRKCISSIKVIRVNNAIINLFKFKTSKELIQNSLRVYNERTYETNKNELVAVANDESSFTEETELLDSKGNMLLAIVQFKMVQSYKRVIFSVIDITERKLTEKVILENRKQIAESRHILSNILENTNVMTAYLDNKFNFIWVNKAYAEAGRHVASFFTGKNHFELYPNEENQAIFQKVVDTGFTYSIDAKPFEHPDQPERGTTYWDWTLKPLKNEFGKVVNLVFTLFDVTESKKAEKALKTSEEKYRRLTENAQDLIYRMSLPDGKYEYVSPTSIKIIEYTPEELYSSPSLIAKLIHPDYNDYFKTEWRKLLKGEMSPTYEYKIITKTGKEKWLFQRNVLIRDKLNNPIAIEGIVTDITDRKKAVDSIKAEKKMNELLLNSMPYPIMLINKKRIVVAANQIALDVGVIIGDYCWKEFGKCECLSDENLILSKKNPHEPSIKCTFCKMDEMFQTKKSVNDPAVNAFGKIWDTYWIPLNENEFLHYAIDITEQKQAEDAIKENEIKFRGIYEQSPIAIEIYDKEGKLIDVNQTTLDIFGVKDKKYVLGFDLWADPNLTTEKMKQLKNGKEICISTDFDFEIVKANNLYPTSRSGKMFMDMYSIPLKNEDEIVGYLVQIVETTERRHAKEEQKKSENLLNSTQKLSKVGGWKYNVEEQSMHWTDETFLIHELDQTVIGTNVNKFIDQSLLCYDKKDRKMVMDAFDKCVDSGESYDLEFPFTSFKGNRIWVRTTAKAEKENDKIVNVIGNIMDITERKQAEVKLRNSEERLKILFDYAPNAYYLNDSKGVFIDGNKAAEKLLGYKKEELIGQSFLKLKLLSSKQMLKASKILMKNFQGKSSGPDEFMITRKAGDQVCVEIQSHPITIKNEIVNLGIAHDISERKKAEEEMREAKEFAENLLETANSIVVTLDINANITSFNKYAEDLTGYQKTDVIGKNWIDIFVPLKDRESLPKVFIKALQSMSEVSRYENAILTKGGKEIVINWNNNVIRDENGNINGLLSIGMDVTERNMARDKLQNYAETQKVLVREVNHRVKNNLSALISMLHKEQDYAKAKGLAPRTVLGDFEDRIRGLANVHTLLSESEWQPIKTSDLCKQIIRGSIENLLVFQSIDLTVNSSKILINSNQAHHLTLVLNELTMNTIKHALKKRETARITVDIKQRKNIVQLCFCDDGPGYPTEMLSGDRSKIGVGFELIEGIVEHSLNGKVRINNDYGAKTVIKFENEI